MPRNTASPPGPPSPPKISELLSVTHFCGHTRVIPVPEGTTPGMIESINKQVACPKCVRGTAGTKIDHHKERKPVQSARKTSIHFPDTSLWLAFRIEALKRGETVSGVLSRMVLEYIEGTK